jgi:cytochrome c-type biogenesis protein CcmH
MRSLVAALIGVLVLCVGVARAVEPDERLADPVLEARARALSRELRCLVCQNTSIDESNAELARDLRILLRERLKAGDSDRQIRAFMVQRYGPWVLLSPPLEPLTWALWLGPPILVVGAGGLLFWRGRGRKPGPVRALSPEEEARLAALSREST